MSVVMGPRKGRSEPLYSFFDLSRGNRGRSESYFHLVDSWQGKKLKMKMLNSTNRTQMLRLQEWKSSFPILFITR